MTLQRWSVVAAGGPRVALWLSYAILGNVTWFPVPDPLFAHQFGWDEILMFAVPIVLALVGVRLAESHVAKRQAAEQANVVSSGATDHAGAAPDIESNESAGDDSA